MKLTKFNQNWILLKKKNNNNPLGQLQRTAEHIIFRPQIRFSRAGLRGKGGSSISKFYEQLKSSVLFSLHWNSQLKILTKKMNDTKEALSPPPLILHTKHTTTNICKEMRVFPYEYTFTHSLSTSFPAYYLQNKKAKIPRNL